MNENETQQPPAANPALVEAAKEAVELQKPIEVTALETIPSQLEATAGLTESEDEEEIFVAATNLKEMNAAQKKLIAWAERKVTKITTEQKAAQVNLDLAKKRKWATDPFKRIVLAAQKKIEFYSKVKAALDAGYTIIPDMPMDVFAIRTSKKNPRKNSATASTTYGGSPNVRSQESNNPPAGEGKFVDPRAFENDHRWEAKDKEGKIIPMMRAWATEFDEQIDFPFKMARPTVLNATAQALSEKLFDEIGAAPAHHVARKGDPMVIGRIFYRQGWHQKGISFLVSWFIDSKDL